MLQANIMGPRAGQWRVATAVEVVQWFFHYNETGQVIAANEVLVTSNVFDQSMPVGPVIAADVGEIASGA